MRYYVLEIIVVRDRTRSWVRGNNEKAALWLFVPDTDVATANPHIPLVFKPIRHSSRSKMMETYRYFHLLTISNPPLY